MKKTIVLSKRKKDVLYLIRMIALEIGAVFLFFLLCYFVKDGSILDAINCSVLLTSMLFMSWIGTDMSRCLVKNKWHIRWMNEEYPVISDIILIVLNWVACPLAAHTIRGLCWIIPVMFLWVFEIVRATINSRTR